MRELCKLPVLLNIGKAAFYLPIKCFQNARSNYLWVLVVAFPFQINAQTCKITGYVKDLGNNSVVFSYIRNGVKHRDTVAVKKDRFVYYPKRSDDGTINVRFVQDQPTVFWYEAGQIAITRNRKSNYLNVRNTPENDVLNNYNRQIKWVYAEREAGKSYEGRKTLELQKQQETLQFIAQNNATYTAAYLLYWETIVGQSPVETYQNLFEKFTDNVRASFYGIEIAKRLEILQNQPLPGRKAPFFALPDTAGNVVNWNQYMGKIILLDFWGHWCAPCIRALPKLKALKDKYQEKLVIVGIAAEFREDKQKWLDVIKNYALDWVQVSELEGDKGKINTQYNIQGFPTYFLVNTEGIIILKSFGLDDIEKTLDGITK